MSASERFKYLPWYVRDFWDDPQVRMLRWIDRAFYQDMLKASWEAGPLPDCEVSILRLIGWDNLGLGHISVDGREVYNIFDAHEIVRELLGQFFTQGPSGDWTNKRLEKEREHARAVIQSNAERLRKANEERARRRDEPRDDVRDDSRDEPRDEDRSALILLPVPALEAQADVRTSLHVEKTQPKAAARKRAPPFDAAAYMDSECSALATVPAARAAWVSWASHRKEMRHPLTARSAKAQLELAASWGPERFEAAVRHSIASGYQGLFEPKNGIQASRPSGLDVLRASAEKYGVRVDPRDQQARARDPGAGGGGLPVVSAKRGDGARVDSDPGARRTG